MNEMPKSKKPKKYATFFIDVDVLKKARAAAKSKNIKISEMAEWGLREYLSKLNED